MDDQDSESGRLSIPVAKFAGVLSIVVPLAGCAGWLFGLNFRLNALEAWQREIKPRMDWQDQTLWEVRADVKSLKKAQGLQ